MRRTGLLWTVAMIPSFSAHASVPERAGEIVYLEGSSEANTSQPGDELSTVREWTTARYYRSDGVRIQSALSRFECVGADTSEEFLVPVERQAAVDDMYVVYEVSLPRLSPPATMGSLDYCVEVLEIQAATTYVAEYREVDRFERVWIVGAHGQLVESSRDELVARQKASRPSGLFIGTEGGGAARLDRPPERVTPPTRALASGLRDPCDVVRHALEQPERDESNEP